MEIRLKRFLSLALAIMMVFSLMPQITIGAEAAGSTTTLYCDAPDSWTNCNVYYWGGSSQATWPGKAMTKGSDGIWSYDVPSDSKNVIFNNGSAQSADLTMPTDDKVQYNYAADSWSTYGASVEAPVVEYVTVYCNAAWSNANAYWWGSSIENPGWPGMAMSKGEDGLWSYAIPEDADGLIFNDGSAQTANLTVQANQYYDVASSKWYANLSDIPTVEAPVYYLRGSMNGWGTDNQMTENNGVYTCTMTLDADTYEYKVANADWSDAYPSKNATLTVEKDGSTVTFTFTLSNKEIKVDVVAPHEHSYEYECSTECSDCDEGTREVSHNYVEGVCSYCGEEDPKYEPPHVHDWSNKDGVCADETCGEKCEHDFDEGSACTICGTVTESTKEIDLSEGSYVIETAGEYIVKPYTGANTLTIKADATVELQGVNITAAEGVSAIAIESGNVTLNVTTDSTVIGGKGGAGVYVAETASITVKGGKLTAIGNAGVDDNAGAAGIGGTKANGNSGAITIDGATVVAKGYGQHGSGIGSGSGKVVGEIKIINNANVTAYGGYYANGTGTQLTDWWGSGDPEGGAAIGGGGKTASVIANITIENSTVTAYGGSKAAGIGVNFWSKADLISITNSTVTAQGGSCSAAIGASRSSSGDRNSYANVVITDSTINATGGEFGSGIGTGYNSKSRTDMTASEITISGGDVTATGGMAAAGIGGGYKDGAATITISGDGNVTAAAGAPISDEILSHTTSGYERTASAIGSGADGDSPATGKYATVDATVSVTTTGTVNVTANEDGKAAIEGMTNEEAKAEANITVTETEAASDFRIITGTVTSAYTDANSFWGEGTSNAAESYVIKIYEGDKVIASASLNDVDNIIDGTTKNVTWNINFHENNDEYWDVEWAEGYPNINMAPTKVTLTVDDKEVATNKACFGAPDYENNIVALAEDKNGNFLGAYKTLADAMNSNEGGTVNILRDVTESMGSLAGNIVTNNPDGVTIKNTIVDEWVYCADSFTIGENVTYDVSGANSGLFVYAKDAVINGTVITDCYYQRDADTKLTINEPGSMTVKTETFILRYTDGDADAGIYIVGDNNDETVGLTASVIYFYQGCINAKDADIKVGTYWQTNTTDNEGSANLILDNSNMTVTVNEHNMKATGNSTVTLTNGSNVTVAGGYEGVGVKMDATSSMTKSNGDSLFMAKIGENMYESFEAALNAVQDGETIELIEGATGDESGVEIDFEKEISFNITGKAPEYALPVVTFKNATVTIKDAEILIPELDARQNATINVVDSIVRDAGGNSIVKSYYNGAINISGTSVVYTMQVTTMGYITVSDTATLNATWQTNVYGNGLITVKDNATFATAALQLTGKEYSDRDNTDADRVGKPATIVVDGANLIVGSVKSAGGADYSYNSSKGINIGTIEGKAALLDIKNGATVNVYMAKDETANIGADGTVNVNGSTFNVACRGEGDVTLANNGTILVSGTSDIAATVSGDGWFYMNGVTLGADTNLIGAKVRFASGTNTVNGSVIDNGFFQVGIGAYNGKDDNVDTENGVVVNVKNAKIGSNGKTYAGWVGSGFYDTDAEKAAAMTDAKYVLNIENSVAEFGYLHVSNDGELNVKGNAAEKAHYNNSDYSFRGGDFIINGTATFDATDVLALYTKVSCDNGTTTPGTLNIVNGTEYEAELHNGANTGKTLNLYKTGVVNVNDATLYVGDETTIAADAKLNVIGATVTANGTVTNNGIIEMDTDSVLTAPSISGTGKIVIDASEIAAAEFGTKATVMKLTDRPQNINDLNIELVNGLGVKLEYSNDTGDVWLERTETVASNGTTAYATVQEAIAAAAKNETDKTVVLLCDVSDAGTVVVNGGVTLDLNGNDLTADYVAAFSGSHVVDSNVEKGTLIVPQDKVMLQANNAQMPVWNEDDGYIFTGMGMSLEKMKAVDGLVFESSFKPSFGRVSADTSVESIAKQFFDDDGIKNNGIEIIIRLSWSSNGSAVHQDFTYSDELVKEVYASNTKFFTLGVTQLADETAPVTAQVIVKSNTGATYVTKGWTYDNGTIAEATN